VSRAFNLEPPTAPHDQPGASRRPRRAARQSEPQVGTSRVVPAVPIAQALDALERASSRWLVAKDQLRHAEREQRAHASATDALREAALVRYEKTARKRKSGESTTCANTLRAAEQRADELTERVIELRAEERRACEYLELAARADARSRLSALRPDIELALAAPAVNGVQPLWATALLAEAQRLRALATLTMTIFRETVDPDPPPALPLLRPAHRKGTQYVNDEC
jgi:hypothetical protein